MLLSSTQSSFGSNTILVTIIADMVQTKLFLRGDTSEDRNKWLFVFQKSVALVLSHIISAAGGPTRGAVERGPGSIIRMYSTANDAETNPRGAPDPPKSPDSSEWSRELGNGHGHRPTVPLRRPSLQPAARLGDRLSVEPTTESNSTVTGDVALWAMSRARSDNSPFVASNSSTSGIGGSLAKSMAIPISKAAPYSISASYHGSDFEAAHRRQRGLGLGGGLVQGLQTNIPAAAATSSSNVKLAGSYVAAPMSLLVNALVQEMDEKQEADDEEDWKSAGSERSVDDAESGSDHGSEDDESG